MSKPKFKKYLQEKGVYHEGYDFLLSLLAHQIQLYNESKSAIKTEGLSTFGSSDKSFTVRNQHIKTLSECIANITRLAEKLGLSVKDSIIFKELSPDDDTDGFDEMKGK